MPPFWILFIKNKIRFEKVDILIKLVNFEGNDCLSLELKDYENLQQNHI